MSSKKRGHRKTHRRKRRVGAFSMKSVKSGTAVKLLSTVAGIFITGKALNDAIDKANIKTDSSSGTPVSSTRVDPMMVIVGEVGIGGLLLLNKKKGTTGLVMNVAGGLIAGAGVRRVLVKAGVLSGFQSVPVIGRHRMAGFQSVPVIGARRMPTQLSGRPPMQLQGFRVNGYVPTGSGVGALGRVGGGSGITTDNGSGFMG